MSTPATTYALDQISQYEWTVDNAKRNAFNNGAMNINNGRDVILMVEGYALNYGINENLAGIQGVTNDVYRLCGAMLQTANQVLTGGTGGGIVPPSGGGGSLIYFPINIVVSSGDISGTYTITNPDWKGLTQLSPSCLLDDTPQTLNTQYTYNIVSGTFDFSLITFQPQVGTMFSTFGFKNA